MILKKQNLENEAENENEDRKRRGERVKKRRITQTIHMKEKVKKRKGIKQSWKGRRVKRSFRIADLSPRLFLIHESLECRIRTNVCTSLSAVPLDATKKIMLFIRRSRC